MIELMAEDLDTGVARRIERALGTLDRRDGAAVYLSADAAPAATAAPAAVAAAPARRPPPICFVIAGGDRPLGVLAVWAHPSSFDAEGRLVEHKRARCERVARQIGRALVSADDAPARRRTTA